MFWLYLARQKFVKLVHFEICNCAAEKWNFTNSTFANAEQEAGQSKLADFLFL